MPSQQPPDMHDQMFEYLTPGKLASKINHHSHEGTFSESQFLSFPMLGESVLKRSESIF